MWRTAILLAALCFASAAVGGQTAPAAFPRIEGETLTGKKIVLPNDLHGSIALLAIGFSQKAGDATRAWSDRFRKDFGGDSRYAVYPVAELEGAPGFVRGMIVRSMRKGTPAAEQDKFVTLFQGQADLKKFVAYSGGDEAYLVLLDAQGVVKWTGHGGFREETYSALLAAAKKLASP